MPCDLIYQQNLAAAERKRKEREREKALTQIEQDLGAGIAAIVHNPDGSYSLEGTPLPDMGLSAGRVHGSFAHVIDGAQSVLAGPHEQV